MPVGVVRPDRHQRHPCLARGEELRVGVRAAVVGNLENVRAEVHAGGEDPALRVGAEVTGEQHPDPAGADPHDHRQVIR